MSPLKTNRCIYELQRTKYKQVKVCGVLCKAFRTILMSSNLCELYSILCLCTELCSSIKHISMVTRNFKVQQQQKIIIIIIMKSGKAWSYLVWLIKCKRRRILPDKALTLSRLMWNGWLHQRNVRSKISRVKLTSKSPLRRDWRSRLMRLKELLTERRQTVPPRVLKDT